MELSFNTRKGMFLFVCVLQFGSKMSPHSSQVVRGGALEVTGSWGAVLIIRFIHWRVWPSVPLGGMVWSHRWATGGKSWWHTSPFFLTVLPDRRDVSHASLHRLFLHCLFCTWAGQPWNEPTEAVNQNKPLLLAVVVKPVSHRQESS